MTDYQIRFDFEHHVLPNAFFTNRLDFIGMLLMDKNSLFYVIKGMMEDKGLECPYTEDQFSIMPLRLNDEISLFTLTFPEPEKGPLCYKCYLFFDEEFSRAMYFCIEKNEKGIPVVCAWNIKGEHVEYMPCSLEDLDDFRKCADIFNTEFHIR